MNFSIPVQTTNNIQVIRYFSPPYSFQIYHSIVHTTSLDPLYGLMNFKLLWKCSKVIILVYLIWSHFPFLHKALKHLKFLQLSAGLSFFNIYPSFIEFYRKKIYREFYTFGAVNAQANLQQYNRAIKQRGRNKSIMKGFHYSRLSLH